MFIMITSDNLVDIWYYIAIKSFYILISTIGDNQMSHNIINTDKFTQSYNSSSRKIINTPSKQAKDTFFYVQEVGRIGVLVPHRSKREKLDSYLFVMVEKGHGHLVYNQVNYELSEGDCFYIDCNETYEQGSSLHDPWTISWVHLHGATSAQYYNLFRQKESPVFTPVDPSPLRNLLQVIMNKTEQKNANTELECSLHLMELLTLTLSTRKATETTNSPMAIKCEHIKTYIDQNYTNRINLDALANEFYVSKFYLTREFKRIYGQSVLDYVIFKRITLAKQLLRYTNGSINEIAMECGFHDQGYFNKQFKKVEHITGSEYRRQWR